MTSRTPIVLAIAVLALVATAGPAVAQDDDPVAQEAADTATQRSIVRVFHETWEEAETLEQAGWESEVLEGDVDDPWRRVHRNDDNPFEPPRATPIRTESGGHAVTVMNDDARYPASSETRLVSPTIDLRYVRGQGVSTTGPYEDQQVAALLEDLNTAYGEQASSFPVGSVHPLLLTPTNFLTDPPAEYFPTECTGTTFNALCSTLQGDEAQRVYYGDTSTDGSGASIPFIGFSSFLQGFADAALDPVPGTRYQGLYAEDGEIHSPNPVRHSEGASYINLTFYHRWELNRNDGAFLEVREKRADGTWTDWRFLEPDTVVDNRNANASARAQERVHDDRAETYNGRIDDHPAFTRTSNGLVASTFNMNRFAGSEIQVGFHLTSKARAVSDLGWILDDVVVWADNHPRDVGVRSIDAPDEMDRVAEDQGFRPEATIQNYGYLPIRDVQVTFSVHPEGNAEEVLWQDVRQVDHLERQETRTLSSESRFVPEEPGDYRLDVNVTPYQATDDADEAGDDLKTPEVTTSRNDNRSIPFQVQTVPEADLAVDLADGSVQTDVGTKKEFTVEIENDGNVPLSGALEVSAQRLNRSTLEPAGPLRTLDEVQVEPGSLPFGKDLTALGADDDRFAASFVWEDNLEPAGVYVLEARFRTDAGNFTGETKTYIRATPAPYLETGLDEPDDSPFDDRSVYSHGMRTDAWVGVPREDGDAFVTERVLPDPPSATHVWRGVGDDGRLGVAGTAPQGEAAEPDSRESTRDTNTVEHYWLTRTVDLTDHPNATSVEVTFYHWGDFAWSGDTLTDQQNASRTRGLVEIRPTETAFFAEPSTPAGSAAPAVDADPRETASAATPNFTISSPEDVYAQRLAAYETDVPWQKETLDITPWAGENVTLRFHLETTAERLKVDSRDDTGEADAGPIVPWLVDNVEVEARNATANETVVSTDLEGDDWRNWTRNGGIQHADPQAPATVVEGRGWDRRGYGADVYPTGWHVVTNRERPAGGVSEVSPMLRWGDPLDRQALPSDVNVSVLESPEFDLGDARDPALTFVHNYTLTDRGDWVFDGTGASHQISDAPDEPAHVHTGGSVWIVGEDEDGDEVVRELLEPTDDSQSQYRGIVGASYTGLNPPGCDETEQGEPGGSEVHCETPLRHYEETLNVFTGRSGLPPSDTGTSRWQRATFDLSPYAAPANDSLDYHLEFHGIKQRKAEDADFGWLIDNLRITESTFANDMAVDELVRPSADETVGPGLKIPVAVRLQNAGLYPQAGVQTTYVVRNGTGDAVFGPVTKTTSPGSLIPGERSDNPDRNQTVVFDRAWETPLEEGTYTVEARVDLSEATAGNAFPDANPSNDLIRRQIDVETRRSVGIQPADVHPDRSSVDPFRATTDPVRTFDVKVENKGTLPEVFTSAKGNAGEFNVTVTVVDSLGETVFSATSPIRSLAPGETQTVSFRNAWQPNRTGLYEVRYQLDHPNETTSNPEADNVRTIDYTVLGTVLPRDDEDLGSMLDPQHPAWTLKNGSWVFGGDDGYPAETEASLRLADDVNLRALKSGVVRLNHSYAFEETYDGAVLEIRPEGADEWTPVPPRRVVDGELERGYPVEMNPASPLDPGLGETRSALSGTSGQRGPTPTSTLFDIGQVDSLVQEAVLVEDPLTATDTLSNRTQTARTVQWDTQRVSDIAPPDGDGVVFHSNATAYREDEWRTNSENSADPSCQDRSADCYTAYATRKFLNITFDETFPEGQRPLAERLDDSDVETLVVSFKELRRIGITDPGTLAAQPNEAEVYLECVGPECPDRPRVHLDPLESNGYDDNYRDWGTTRYKVDAATLAPLAGQGKEVRLSFVHHTLNNPVDSQWETDFFSGHPGWFIDDVSVGLELSDGSTSTYWSDDLDDYNRSYEDNVTAPVSGENGTQEVLETGPWSGSVSAKRQDGSENHVNHSRLLWDPVEGWGQDLWRWNEEGELRCGDLTKEFPGDPSPDYIEDEDGDVPYLDGVKSDRWTACGPTDGDRDRAGGSRLVTTLDLRPAVDDVTLRFDHTFRFRTLNPPQASSETSEAAVSGGQVQVSVDGGETWIPVLPENHGNHVYPLYGTCVGEYDSTAIGSCVGPPTRSPDEAVHTTLAGRDGDPEGNSVYGVGGAAFSGVSGPLGNVDVPEPTRGTEIDLSAFAGREVKVAWHAYFGTQTHDQPHEFWSVDNVSVEADVLDGQAADLRLRAATDETETDEGWTVNELRLAGVKNAVNVGTRIVDLPEEGPVDADRETSFGVAFVNKGETPVTVDATVNVTGGTSPFQANGTVSLAPGERVVRDALDEPLAYEFTKADHQVTSTVRIQDDGARRDERIRSDNTDTVDVDADQIYENSRLTIRDLSLDPNHVAPADGDPMEVALTVENVGFAEEPAINALEVTFTASEAEDPALTLEAGDLADNPGLSFAEPFQEKTFVWRVSPDQVEALPGGVYDVEASLTQDRGSAPSGNRTDEASDIAYAGAGYLDENAYRNHVQETETESQGCVRGSTAELSGYSAQQGSAAGDGPPVATWDPVQTNNTPTRSFGTEFNQPHPESQFGGHLVCEFEDAQAVGEDPSLSFYTRWKWRGQPENATSFEAQITTVDDGQCTGEDFETVTTVFSTDDIPTESPGFRKGEFVRYSGSVPEEADMSGSLGCVRFFTALGAGAKIDAHNVDDIAVSQYDVETTPDRHVIPIQDDTTKRFPFQVRNAGGFNDTYRFAFVDEFGEPTSFAPGWETQVVDADGEPLESLELAAGETRTVFLEVHIPAQSAGSFSSTTSGSVTAISTSDPLVRDTTEFVFDFDSPARPNLDVIDVTVNGEDLPAGRPRSITVTVANLGAEAVDGVPVEIVDTMPPRFGEPPRKLTRVDGDPLAPISLEPAQTTTLIAGWRPSRAGPHNLTVHVDPGDDVAESSETDNVVTTPVTVGAASFPDLVSTISVSDAEPQAGTGTFVNATITNEGEAPAQGVRVNYRVGVSDLLDGRPPHILDEVIEPGETVELSARWPAAFPGDYQAFVKAIPLSGTLEPASTQDDNLADEAITVRAEGLGLDAPDGKANVTQASRVTVPLTVENRAESADTFDLVADAPGDLRARLTDDGVTVTSVDLPNSTERSVSLEVRTPSRIEAGTYRVTVTATSQATGESQSVVVPVRVERSPGLSLRSASVDVDPGARPVTAQVTNTGNAPTTVNLTAPGLPEGWTLESEPTTLGPFSEAEVGATLRIPTSTNASVRSFTLVATGDAARDTAPFRVDVGERGVVDVRMDPDDVSLRPGTNPTFDVTLASVGNVPASTSHVVEAPDGWTVRLPRPQAHIEPGENVTFPLHVDIPDDAAEGDRQVRLVAATDAERFAGNASVTVGVPDAAVTNVDQNPRVNVEEGTTVSFASDVRNTGGLALDTLDVGLYVDDTLMDLVTVDGIGSGGLAEASLNWTATPGEHVILVVADPAEDLVEEDEGNNARLLVVQVGGDVGVFGGVERPAPGPGGVALLAAFAGAALALRRRR